MHKTFVLLTEDVPWLRVTLGCFLVIITPFCPHVPGSPSGGKSSPFPGMCSLCPPLQSWQLAGMDEGTSREHHQKGPFPGPLPNRGQQTEPEVTVERSQTLLPMGRCKHVSFVL